jgi:N-acetylglucosaminyl-diphospho-decaprenol L-rhamnosyltransferase
MQREKILARQDGVRILALDLVIVIVNFNTRDLLRNCLTSIYASRGSFSYAVCVVDNASSDGSADMVRHEFSQTHLIESQINGGFAYANNLGLRHYGFGAAKQDSKTAASDAPRFALLLNPDTEVPPDGLAAMLGFMEDHPEAGVAGAKLVLESGQLDLACRRSFPTPEVSFYRMVGLSKLFPNHRKFGRYNLTYLNPDETAEVDAVVGAFMLVRGEAISQTGLLDETFFMYGEDLDWAFRIVQAGWKVYYFPKVTVLHVKRAASRHSLKAQQEFYRAMRIFYDKHYAATTPWWLHWLIVTGINLRAGAIDLEYRLARPRPEPNTNQADTRVLGDD